MNHVRELRADEWPLLKALRLAALASDPDAFGPTHAEEAARDDATWQRGARFFASPYGRMFVGYVGDSAQGLISATRDRAGTGHLGAFWVHPDARGTGLGATLFDTALAWLDAWPCARVELSVTEGNDSAVAMYARRGFVLDGRFEPLRAGSPLRNLYMTREPATR